MLLSSVGRPGSALRYGAVAALPKRITSAATCIRYLPLNRRPTVAVSAIAHQPTDNEKQKAPAQHSVVDVHRRRLRFGENPCWLQQYREAKSDGRTFRTCLQDPSKTLQYLSEQWKHLIARASDRWGNLQYNYFNWRQDTSKDLLLIFALFSSLLLLGSSTRRFLIDSEEERGAGGFWNDMFQVCKWVFGQEFPGPDSPVSQQAFAVVTAMVGLCAFALVLALVEQVVLEGMEANVKRGSRVYETGHHLILGWCVSQRDLEVVRKILQQICRAYKPEGGTKVVVLTQRSKTEMEAIFWRCLPAAQRYETKLIFRQGSPLIPSDLKNVGASQAASTVVVSDQSRSASEADAQAIRCAILLDELDAESTAERDAAFSSIDHSIRHQTACAMSAVEREIAHMQQLDMTLAGRQVVVELKTSNALPLLKYACSNKTIALPTSQLNAQRLAKMVKRPVISIVSQQLFNFENRVSIFVHYYPHLVGHRFGELAFLFPDGIVMGVVDRITGKARMAPAKDYVILGTQALVICRPTTLPSQEYRPLQKQPDMAELLPGYSNSVINWPRRPTRALTGTAQFQRSGLVLSSSAGAGEAAPAYSVSEDWLPAMEDWSKAGLSQVEALRRQVELERQVFAATASSASDHLSSITSPQNDEDSNANGTGEQNNIVTSPSWSKVEANSLVGMSQLVAASHLMTASNVVGRNKLGHRPVSAMHSVASSRSASPLPAIPAWQEDHELLEGLPCTPQFGAMASGSSGNASSINGRKTPNSLRTGDWPVLAGTRTTPKNVARGYNALWQLKFGNPAQQQQLPIAPRNVPTSQSIGYASTTSHTTPAFSYEDHLAVVQATLRVPSEYLQVDEGPERVLVLGWGPNSLMADLIKELDHGLSALPEGSEVVFVNTHSPDETLGAVLQNTSLEDIKVRHVHANPLQRNQLAAKLDMAAFRCALVLCDELWVDPDKDDNNGIDSLDEPSVLRLDSLVMVAQLNIRKLLEDQRLPPINIICQKVATEGLTRFEDRHRLPLGISVNLNSFSAKTLAQIAVNPLMLYPVTRLGEDAQLTIVDSSDYAGLNESINFWQLVARCQEVGDVLLGYYGIPEHMDEPLNTVVDPEGMDERCAPRAWNTGDGRLKFIILRGVSGHTSSSGSVDDQELEHTTRAHWVASRANTSSRNGANRSTTPNSTSGSPDRSSSSGSSTGTALK